MYRERVRSGEIADGVLAVAESMDEPMPVNLGTGREVAIADLVQMIATEVGFDGEIRWNSSYPDGQPRRSLDISRARERTGWEARVSLEDGIKKTVQWWLEQGRAVARDEQLKKSA